MFAVGACIGLAVCLIGYLFGGLIGMTIAGFLTFAGALVFGIFDYRRFQRERAKAIAQRLSASSSAPQT